jgi:hypothetical protein
VFRKAGRREGSKSVSLNEDGIDLTNLDLIHLESKIEKPFTPLKL